MNWDNRIAEIQRELARAQADFARLDAIKRPTADEQEALKALTVRITQLGAELIAKKDARGRQG